MWATHATFTVEKVNFTIETTLSVDVEHVFFFALFVRPIHPGRLKTYLGLGSEMCPKMMFWMGEL